MFIKYKSVLLSLITHTQIEIVKLSGHTSLIKAINIFRPCPLALNSKFWVWNEHPLKLDDPIQKFISVYCTFDDTFLFPLFLPLNKTAWIESKSNPIHHVSSIHYLLYCSANGSCTHAGLLHWGIQSHRGSF